MKPTKGAKGGGKNGLAAFEFPTGVLTLTEARAPSAAASLHLARGRAALTQFARGGAEVFDITLDDFAGVLIRENHTIKRALTDPRGFSGIGNAYSDEILHRARLSPIKLTSRLTGRRNLATLRRDAQNSARRGPIDFAPSRAKSFPRK